MECNQDDIDEVQSLKPMVDYDRNHLSKMPFPHYDGHRNAIGYAICEESADGHVQLEEERPLI